MTLNEAVAVFYPSAPLTMSSLRTEIARGRLPAAKIAGRWFVTPANLRALFEPRLLPCPESQKDPAFTLTGCATPAPPGSWSATFRPGKRPGMSA